MSERPMTQTEAGVLAGPRFRDLSPLTRLFAAAAVAGACLYVVVYVVIATARMTFPFELEWIEGATVEHVMRILEGKPIYRRPSTEFIANIYPALYDYVAAGVSLITGPGFFPLRIVSFVCSLGLIGLIGRFIHRETGNQWCGIIGAGFFAAQYKDTGGWFDVGARDSMFLLLTVGSAYFIRFHQTIPGYIVAGALFVLAGFTKQMAATLILPLVPYVLGGRLRPAAAFIITSSLALPILLVANHVSGGWFYYYTVQLPSEHPLQKWLITGYWTNDILPMGIALAIGAYALFRRRKETPQTVLFYALFTSGALLTAWYSRLHTGGFINTLMPAAAGISLLFGIGIAHLQRSDAGRLSKQQPLLWGLVLIQFLIPVYRPWLLVPTAADRAAGFQMMQKARQIDGDVCFLYHAYLPRLIGQQPFVHIMSYEAVRWGRPGALKDELEKEMHAVFKTDRFKAVILDSGEWPAELRSEVELHYKPYQKLFDDPDVFFPVVGFQIRPETIYLRK